mmetsp:Transcript_16079/g.25035  ORF Transcript_16079/g.25035 Transcript_16079/m.25035 type:complete len:159 (-) Transcript_16079:20-496(-)
MSFFQNLLNQGLDSVQTAGLRAWITTKQAEINNLVQLSCFWHGAALVLALSACYVGEGVAYRLLFLLQLVSIALDFVTVALFQKEPTVSMSDLIAWFNRPGVSIVYMWLGIFLILIVQTVCYSMNGVFFIVIFYLPTLFTFRAQIFSKMLDDKLIGTK